MDNKKLEYEAFWNSAPISTTNASDPCRKLFQQVINTKYANKDFPVVDLHGNPGRHKSQFIIDWCALHHISPVGIPIDLSINKSIINKLK